MKKTILIEVNTIVPVKNYYIQGIGQATKALLNSLNNLENIPYNIELYAKGFAAYKFDFYGWRFKHRVLPVPSRYLDQRNVESYLRSKVYKYDVFHITNNYYNVAAGEPFFCTIHDCTDMDIRYSEDLASNKRDALKMLYLKMAENSLKIVTVSNSSKEDIVNYFNVPSEKVFVNHLGIDREKFKVLPPEKVNFVLRKYGISKPYFFACSCNRPRKNLITALRAYKRFLTYSPNHIFVVAWKNPFKEITEEFSNEIQKGKIVFLPFLSDEELVAFYCGASMTIYVSRKEGFGMPILESFACGTPVMTCHNSSLYEVGQDAAIYVGEDCIDEMVDIMTVIEYSKFNYDEFLKRSEIILDHFTWNKTAKRCIDFYDSVFENNTLF